MWWPKQVRVNFWEALYLFERCFVFTQLKYTTSSFFPVPHSFPGYSGLLFPFGLTIVLYIFHNVTHNNLLHVCFPSGLQMLLGQGLILLCVSVTLAWHLVHSWCSICFLNG